MTRSRKEHGIYIEMGGFGRDRGAPREAPPEDPPARSPAAPSFSSAEQRQQFQAIDGRLASAGVNESARSAAASWFLEHAQRPPATEPVNHRYTVDESQVPDDARPYLTPFLNAMAAAGATQEDVAAALKVHRELRGQATLDQMREAEEVDRLDRDDARRAEGALRNVWGVEYEANVRLIDQYLRTLPASKREQIEQERDADGTLALNNPKRLRELAAWARRGPVSADGQRKTEGEELDELRVMMRDRGSRYWKGRDAERLQARYRDLIRKGYS
jgi:hypothetical protein